MVNVMLHTLCTMQFFSLNSELILFVSEPIFIFYRLAGALIFL